MTDETPTPAAFTATTGGDAQTIADLATAAASAVHTEDSVVMLVVPAGGRVESHDVERFHQTPERARGVAKPKSLQAFVDYVHRHADAYTTVWVEPLEGRIVAVLNDHGSAQTPGWGDLRAELVLPATPEWEHWMSRHRVYGSQREFAEHIQDGLAEIRTPASADVLELVQDFQATITAEFRSASRLATGAVKAVWSEDVTTTTEIPPELTLALSPFYGEEPYELVARIRYRIAGGEFTIGYELDRPERVVLDALARIREKLVTEFGANVYTGEPAPAVGPR